MQSKIIYPLLCVEAKEHKNKIARRFVIKEVNCQSYIAMVNKVFLLSWRHELMYFSVIRCSLTIYIWKLSMGWVRPTTSTCTAVRSFWFRVKCKRFIELFTLKNVHLASVIGDLFGPAFKNAARLHFLMDENYHCF